MTPEAKKGFASYRCATIDLFDIQVVFIVGDRHACARLIDRDRSPSYKGPKIGDGFLVGLEHVDKDSSPDHERFQKAHDAICELLQNWPDNVSTNTITD